MSTSKSNPAESIRHRLRDKLRANNEDIQFGLTRYAIERFLYRLGRSSQRNRFILKGAALFALWGGAVYRPTRDLDFTSYGSSKEADVLDAIREICLIPCDGEEMIFIPESLSAETIRDETEYQGLRVRLTAALGGSRIPVQIDIGFANAIEPPPQEVQYPTLLGDPAPTIRAYPTEAVIAEKLHAMVSLGERNSRYKDFYDLYVLSRQFLFEGPILVKAIDATFKRRRTAIDFALPSALQPRFYEDDNRLRQWRIYLGRNSLPGAPADFAVVGEGLRSFLVPVWNSLAEKSILDRKWTPGGPWK
jgi:predicted nucleotidyltransferase component of viral defense system